MNTVHAFFVLLALLSISNTNGQRITTIQLDGVQYFVSRMNPYSPELNFFLAYQYCRSLGLQLVSFETREKADSVTQYLSNAGYSKYDFWTSGNKLGTDMFLWMSTGLPFNATFDYMKKGGGGGVGVGGGGAGVGHSPSEILTGSTAPQRTARDGGEAGASDGCVLLKAPHFEWSTEDCTEIKDFICEQTRCYYYNYGSIPVSTSQGLLGMSKPSKPFAPSTTARGVKERVDEASSPQPPPTESEEYGTTTDSDYDSESTETV